jgi:hypothetical protein
MAIYTAVVTYIYTDGQDRAGQIDGFRILNITSKLHEPPLKAKTGKGTPCDEFNMHGIYQWYFPMEEMCL